MSDSTQDQLSRAEGFNLMPDTAQLVGYTYSPGGAMNAPTSYGWNFNFGNPHNPPPVTAFIRPPTSGPRNTPLGSVDIQFTHPVTSLSISSFDFEGLNPTGLTLAMFNGGLSWTVGNLAPQQTADGEFALKLFAVGSGIVGGGDVLMGSTGIKWTLDTVAPSVTTSSFEFLTRHALRVAFTEDVGASLSPGDIVLRNLTNNTTIPAGAMALAFDAAANAATVTFPGLAGGILPDGDYRATLAAAGITDRAGNALAADAQVDFFVMGADANRDRRVNLQDFNILAGNFGQPNRDFAHGDFNYSGNVNLQDFNILAARFGTVLASPGAGTSAIFGRARAGGADPRDDEPAFLA